MNFYRVVLIVVVLSLFLGFEIIIVNGESMEPTLENKEVLIAKKIYSNKKKYDKDDIVVLKKDQTTYIKRIAAIPGDEISCEKNKLYINDDVKENFSCDNGLNIKLDENEYFVLGDNTNNSIDSRNFGKVTNEEIKSKIILGA